MLIVSYQFLDLLDVVVDLTNVFVLFVYEMQLECILKYFLYTIKKLI